jgi:hypothetical protein
MKSKQVIRYYCDYCKKTGYSKGHMAKHEIHCTKNPDRICRVCTKLLQQDQPPLKDIIALLPTFDWQQQEYTTDAMESAIDEILPKVRDAASGCPVCIMAAFRQKGIPLPVVKNFNYTNEIKAIWNDINESNMRDEYSGY